MRACSGVRLHVLTFRTGMTTTSLLMQRLLQPPASPLHFLLSANPSFVSAFKSSSTRTSSRAPRFLFEFRRRQSFARHHRRAYLRVSFVLL